MFVEFSDASKTAMIAVFSGPADINDHPVQGEIEPNDPRYAAFYNSLPTGISDVITTPGTQ